MSAPGGDRELLFSVRLEDCIVQHFRSGGKGGQHQNKSNSGTRIIHEPSGARGESREYREQPRNTRAAFMRLARSMKFLVWVNKQVWLNGRDPEAEVRREMQKHNLLIEAFRDGKWEVIG